MLEKFVTTISCMDGRIQRVVQDYMMNRFGRMYVDMITAAGPAKILSEDKKQSIIDNIKFRTTISVNGHESNAIAVVGHFDCAGIRLTDDLQKEHIIESVKNVKKWYRDIKVIGLWVDENLKVTEL